MQITDWAACGLLMSVRRRVIPWRMQDLKIEIEALDRAHPRHAHSLKSEVRELLTEELKDAFWLWRSSGGLALAGGGTVH